MKISDTYTIEQMEDLICRYQANFANIVEEEKLLLQDCSYDSDQNLPEIEQEEKTRKSEEDFALIQGERFALGKLIDDLKKELKEKKGSPVAEETAEGALPVSKI